jgi:predicted MFS family arabinose efflux permease
MNQPTTYRPKDLLFFISAISIFGFAQGIVDSTLNNYLYETFSLSFFDRGMMELPRELPGFLVIFMSALLFFLSDRRLAAWANLIAGVGIFLIGFLTRNFSSMLFFLFIYSIGQHLFIPLNLSIGMQLAEQGRTGRRLGQFNGAINLFAIVGSLAVFIGFRFFNFNFKISFLMASFGFIGAGILIFFMKPNKPTPAKTKFILRKEYALFYWLNILFGTRKQIFLTFAPWVLVSVFFQKTYVMGILLTIGGVLGIFFKPVLGRLIDRLGERVILGAEALILIFICFFYGFAKIIFQYQTALYIAFACYIFDYLLMSVGMARATYLKKIAVRDEDVSQTLTMGVTIDHVFSILIAISGGLVWQFLGYQYIFLIGSFIAVINFISVLFIRTEKL